MLTFRGLTDLMNS